MPFIEAVPPSVMAKAACKVSAIDALPAGKLAPALKQAVTDDGETKGPTGPVDKSVEKSR